ncbi:MAG TPA: hypothetical protein VFI84_02715 [Candidatus Saccharimonadales bacterium]|nr:hypothetical protein [Candidatus Saccharimonadales bacterium]
MDPTTPTTSTPATAPTPTPSVSTVKPAANTAKPKLGIAVVALLVVVAAVAIWLALSAQSQAKKATKAAADMNARVTKIETADKYVGTQINADENQAVFLSTGQVYFGKITHLTPDTMTLEHIYYLNGNGSFDKTSQSTSGNVSLVKLGNELHKPEDKMIIETKNVEFWENIKNDSEVSKAIASYEKNNPSH